MSLACGAARRATATPQRRHRRARPAAEESGCRGGSWRRAEDSEAAWRGAGAVCCVPSLENTRSVQNSQEAANDGKAALWFGRGDRIKRGSVRKPIVIVCHNSKREAAGIATHKVREGRHGPQMQAPASAPPEQPPTYQNHAQAATDHTNINDTEQEERRKTTSG